LPLSVSTHAANHHEVRLVQLCFDFYMIEAKPENGDGAGARKQPARSSVVEGCGLSSKRNWNESVLRLAAVALSHANRLHSHDAEDRKRQHAAEVVSLH
jgi:hypothetical protein